MASITCMPLLKPCVDFVPISLRSLLFSAFLLLISSSDPPSLQSDHVDESNNNNWCAVANVPSPTDGFMSKSVNARGDLYTVWDNAVYRLKAFSTWLEWFAGAKTSDECQAKDGDRYQATFQELCTVEANDDYGRIWTVDRSAHAIRAIIGSELVTIAGRLGEKGSRDGPPAFARFRYPISILRLFSRPSFLISEGVTSIRLMDAKTLHISTLKLDFGTLPLLRVKDINNGFTLRPNWSAGYPVPPNVKDTLHAVYISVDNKTEGLNIDVGSGKVSAGSADIALIGSFFPYSTWFSFSPQANKWRIGITSMHTEDQAVLQASISYLLNVGVIRKPIYVPQTNSIVQWSSTLSALQLVENMLKPTPPPPSIPHQLASTWEKHLPEPIDFSSLIESPIIGDIPFEFKKSGRIINLHSRVLKLNKGLKNKYKAVVSSLETSNLPERSIEAFINYLYFKRISIDDNTDIKSLSIELGHVAWLCKEHGVEPSKVLFDLYSLILPRITNDDLIACLIECWSSPLMQWTKTDPFITLLASHLRLSPNGTESFSTAVEDSDLPAKRVVPLMTLFTNAGAVFVIEDAVSFAYINRGPKKWVIQWQQTDDPSSLFRHPSDYIFGRAGSDMWTAVPSEYVWAQWSWFKRLVASGMEESKTRIIRFGSWMDQPTIELLVSCLCRGEAYKIEVESAKHMVRHAKEYGFVDDQGIPTSCFAHMFVNSVSSCRFSATRDHNKLLQLQIYHDLGFEAKTLDLMGHVTNKDHPSSLADALDELSLDLLIKFRELRIKQKQKQKAEKK